jgi:hypothetical protein
VDFTALNTIKATEAKKATSNITMLKQPNGTNHFQFRFHQFGLGVRETGGGFCSTAFSTSAAKAFATLNAFGIRKP